jgi:hypothetical protein
MTRQQAELLFGGIGQGALVAENHRQAAGAQHFSRPAQCHAERLRIERALGMQPVVGLRDAIKQLQQALLAAPWLDFLLLATEYQTADPVVVAQRCPADEGRGLGSQH